MIRWWSYVNLINQANTNQYKTFECFSNDAIFKESTVFRKKRSQHSLVRRKAWKRRRHWNQWLNYYNILFNWSQSYTMHNRYLRFAMIDSLFKNSFFSYNGIEFRTLSSGFIPGLEYFNYVSFSRRTSTFMWRKVRYEYQLFNFIKNSQAVYITSNANTLKQFTEHPLTPSAVFPVLEKSSLIYDDVIPINGLIKIFWSIQFRYWTAYLVEYYKLMIKLTILQTMK